MLSSRAEIILKSIVRQYIAKAAPVSSSGVIENCGLDVCSATVRNEMARLEEEGYIIRPHHSSGSVPTDKAYRYYVGLLEDVTLPNAEQFLISHLFHQVERELEEWLNLTTRLIANQVHNMAVVTQPRPASSKFHHLELVYLSSNKALGVIILRGAIVKQQLISFEDSINQEALTIISNRLNSLFSGLTRAAIERKTNSQKMSKSERHITDLILKIIKTEDETEYQESYMDGLHYMMDQPEFKTSERMQALIEMIEQRKLGKVMMPEASNMQDIQVFIGKENRDEIIQDFSVILSRYGLPEEAEGMIGILGPTRMHYERAISTIRYLSQMMSTLVGELYGRELPAAHQE
jgi:heat-inducible transcriptional repressor